MEEFVAVDHREHLFGGPVTPLGHELLQDINREIELDMNLSPLKREFDRAFRRVLHRLRFPLALRVIETDLEVRSDEPLRGPELAGSPLRKSGAGLFEGAHGCEIHVLWRPYRRFRK